MTTGCPALAGTDLGESHTFQYTIDLSPPPKKTKTKPARKSKVKKPPKPKVTKPPKQRVSITPEERAQRRRAYEQARNQLPHRRERNRVEAKERHRQAKELGLCRTCPSPAMPGQTRCQDCVEKRRLYRIRAREKATQHSLEIAKPERKQKPKKVRKPKQRQPRTRRVPTKTLNQSQGETRSGKG